jgi:chemotaxis protein MotB
MMAFFLLMWLVAATTKEQRGAISEYFNNPSMAPGKASAPSPGMSGPGGASTSMIKLGAMTDAPQPKPKVIDPKSLKALAKEEEKKRLETLMQQLREAIEKSQALEPFKDQLLLDITPDGLRIQIVDKLARPMFDSGSASLKDYTTAILKELGTFVDTVPNHISISGHTDTGAYGHDARYTNWELSTDRANAARRALVGGGLHEDKVALVVGLASTVPFDKANPQAPINRRISIVVMNKDAEAAASGQAEGQPPSAEGEPANPTSVGKE